MEINYIIIEFGHGLIASQDHEIKQNQNVPKLQNV